MSDKGPMVLLALRDEDLQPGAARSDTGPAAPVSRAMAAVAGLLQIPVRGVEGALSPGRCGFIGVSEAMAPTSQNLYRSKVAVSILDLRRRTGGSWFCHSKRGGSVLGTFQDLQGFIARIAEDGR